MLALALLTFAGAELLVPEGTDTIAQEAFRGDASIRVVELPEGIRSIEARAFAESGVTEINLPETLEKIADDAFQGCSKELVARGVSGGKAEAYCKKNGIRFVPYNPRVGIALPTNEADYWVRTAKAFYSGFASKGIEIDIRYAQANAGTQAKQIRALVEEGVDVLVFAPILNDKVKYAVDEAGKAGIRTIDYERLLSDSQYVDYYATFAPPQVGASQGGFVREYCKLDTAKEPLNIEFFGGAKEDANAMLYFSAAYAQVEPYLKNGKLVCPSGETSFEKAYTEGWITENAYNRMKRLLKEQYPDAPKSGKRPDIILCSNDTTAIGVIHALSEAGFAAKDMPVITGQDCDLESVRYIRDGMQTMSVFKDSDALVKHVVSACMDLLDGKAPKTDGTMDNGAKAVPFLSVDPVIVTRDNYVKILVESGIYSKEALEG